MKFEPFVVLDIETTGLDPEQHTLLEVAAIYVGEDLEIVDTFNVCIKPYDTPDLQISPYVLNMHLNSGVLRYALNSDVMLVGAIEAWKEWRQKHFSPWNSILYAGKNLLSFDIPFLKHHGFVLQEKHRVIDVGSVYWAREGTNASMPALQGKYVEFEYRAHIAIEDCRITLDLLRVAAKREARPDRPGRPEE